MYIPFYFFLVSSTVVNGAFLVPRNIHRVAIHPSLISQQVLLSTSSSSPQHVRLYNGDNQGQEPDNPQTPNPVLKFVQAVFRGGYLMFAFCQISLGIALSLGLLLNLSGYAYTISWKDGLVVDTIQKLREEQQFRKAAYAPPPLDRESLLPR
jgi:hypothetical protein